MTLSVFPSFRYKGWPFKRRSTFDTLVQQTSSRKTVRLSYDPYPLYEWELVFGDGTDDTGFIPDDPDDLFGTNLDTDLVTIQGFYEQMLGRFNVFLFDDPNDDNVEAQQIGTGDGTTTAFQLVRSRGGSTIPIQCPFTLPAPNIYDNGVLKSVGTDYGISNPGGLVTFVTAPAAGHVITADFSYYFPVRFDDDVHEHEQFMVQLWKLKSIKLIQERL